MARRGQLIVLEAVSMGFGAVPERVLLLSHLVVRTQRPQKHHFRHQRLSYQARIREISISGSLSLSVDRLDLGTRSISRISSGRHLKLLSSISRMEIERPKRTTIAPRLNLLRRDRSSHPACFRVTESRRRIAYLSCLSFAILAKDTANLLL